MPTPVQGPEGAGPHPTPDGGRVLSDLDVLCKIAKERELALEMGIVM
jgi:hypothetical protein